MKTISKSLVRERERLPFLIKQFGNLLPLVENACYDTLSRFCTTYRGAYWHLYKLSNEGFYLAPDIKEALHVCIESNGYEGKVSSDAAGVIVSLFVLNGLALKTSAEKYIHAYYDLRAFALEHEEAFQIFAAID
ncbi:MULTISPECIES: antirestriction protein [Legionella]|uniref:antirestriction protein n=1 Tax=Legionella TaxID=445 RepID=UPI000F8D7A63|nr:MULTISPECIES: antirestriction protein [Legionella]MCP0914968.1 antirestriction protein [Legionella sp. 27cVA30]RUR10034.1 antirestriction protein [Legionella septentrionalis]